MKTIKILVVIVFCMLLGACHPAIKTLGNPELPYPPSKEPVVGDILHMPTGIYVDQQSMYNHALRSRVIFVGETHDNPASHRLQEEILRTLQQNHPGHVALAMEMFTPSQQPILDRWTAGELSEKEFLKQVGWYRNWHMNFAFYRGLLTYCRDQRIPIIALNSEKQIKRMVGRTPLEQLDDETRSQLPQMTADPYQQAMVKAVYSGHAMGKVGLDGFQRVQTLWDETMAENLAIYLQGAGPERQVMVIAGGNHIRYGFGIPRRMFRRIPLDYILIGSTELDVPPDKQDRLMDIHKPDYPMLPYHFLVYTSYEDLPNPGVKLGIVLEKTDAGLLIKQVTPGSTAEANDLREADILTTIDNHELIEAFDLIYELQQKKPGDSIELNVLRQGAEIVLNITFSDKAE